MHNSLPNKKSLDHLIREISKAIWLVRQLNTVKPHLAATSVIRLPCYSVHLE